MKKKKKLISQEYSQSRRFCSHDCVYGGHIYILEHIILRYRCCCCCCMRAARQTHAQIKEEEEETHIKTQHTQP